MYFPKTEGTRVPPLTMFLQRSQYLREGEHTLHLGRMNPGAEEISELPGGSRSTGPGIEGPSP